MGNLYDNYDEQPQNSIGNYVKPLYQCQKANTSNDNYDEQPRCGTLATPNLLPPLPQCREVAECDVSLPFLQNRGLGFRGRGLQGLRV